MYSWDGDTSSWYGDADYAYSSSGAALRSAAASRASAHGPRTYERKSGPIESVIDPKKRIRSESKNPLIVGIDVTGSMASWPFEIFDRLPLLYNTLSQYRPDLEICFAAIGDAKVDRWPLQVTDFASGFDLEQLLGSLYGEGSGGDAPESYGLFAHWVNTHVEVPRIEEPPFFIMFGDATMHESIAPSLVDKVIGDKPGRSVDALKAWQKVTETWNVWFMRRATGVKNDKVDQQWGQAVGEQKIFHIDDEQRAVDYAMGLIARAWGHYDDFRTNMLARQSEEKVKMVSRLLEMKCPRCGAPIPLEAMGMFSCEFCGATLNLS
ncbi:MAG: zinc ribbon domain-containing protein [Anaerolineae bacterium]|nr:zinc ribbon domain-containing protein [Anaerolineae bacterium]